MKTGKKTPPFRYYTPQQKTNRKTTQAHLNTHKLLKTFHFQTNNQAKKTSNKKNTLLLQKETQKDQGCTKIRKNLAFSQKTSKKAPYLQYGDETTETQ